MKSSRQTRSFPFFFGDYKFLQMIGKGGFAEVFLVTNTKYDDNLFVAKVMNFANDVESMKNIKSFDAEISALSKLNHPNIIRIYDHFQHNEKLCLILEYCPNGSLMDEIERNNGLSLARFIEVSKQLVDALHYCHSQGVAHRDIKPNNVLLEENRRVKLADFGLCMSNMDGSLQKRFGGSMLYTAPEIFQKKPHDPLASDIWALGVAFYIMLTGKSPWNYNSLGEFKQIVLSGALKLSNSIPPMVAELIRNMLVIDPSQRLTIDQIAKSSLFRNSSMNLRMSFPMPKKKIPKLNWNQIERKDFDDDFIMSGDVIKEDTHLNKTNVRVVSSLFLHSRAKKDVKRRVHKKLLQVPNVTFGNEVTELSV